MNSTQKAIEADLPHFLVPGFVDKIAKKVVPNAPST